MGGLLRVGLSTRAAGNRSTIREWVACLGYGACGVHPRRNATLMALMYSHAPSYYTYALKAICWTFGTSQRIARYSYLHAHRTYRLSIPPHFHD